jgi:hypothetical protein
MLVFVEGLENRLQTDWRGPDLAEVAQTLNERWTFVLYVDQSWQ